MILNRSVTTVLVLTAAIASGVVAAGLIGLVPISLLGIKKPAMPMTEAAEGSLAAPASANATPLRNDPSVAAAKNDKGQTSRMAVNDEPTPRGPVNPPSEFEFRMFEELRKSYASSEPPTASDDLATPTP